MADARVVVADDDPEMLDAVADALTRLGYEVARADSGEALVDCLATDGPFDLIVTDISMPWMDGLRTMRSMRTAGVATPVIVMTALGSRDLSAEVQALGPDAVLLRKPFDVGELEAAVARLHPAARRSGAN